MRCYPAERGNVLSIRGKIIVLVLALELVLTIVSGTLFINEHYKRNEELAKYIATNLRNNFIDHSTTIQDKYRTRIEGFVKSSPAIINAFAKRDLSDLTINLEQRINTLRKEDQLFSSINFIHADGTVFYHTKDKKRIGQNVSHIPFVRDSLKDRKPLSGLVLALSGLGYRFSYPVYLNDKYVGIIVFITDATHSLEMLSKNFEIQWGILINKENIVQGSEMQMIANNGKLLVASSGGPFNDKGFLEVISQTAPLDVFQSTESYHRKLYTLALKNYAGVSVGEIITVLDISKPLSDFRASLYNAGMIILAVLVVTIIVLFQGIGFFLKKVRETQHQLEETVDQRTKQLQETNHKLSQEITQHELTQKDLESLSVKDALTGLFNRRKFNDQYETEWNAALRASRYISLIMIDIDCFKPYNDTYGHLAGDEALRTVAQAIQKNVTRPRDCVARFGGEEFICILPETSMDATIHVAEMIRKSVEELHYIHEFSSASNVITVSIGLISAIPEKFQDKKELIDLADKALYRAKSAGRNCIKAS